MTVLQHPARQQETADFRSFFRRHAAGVSIITALTADGPVGFTASSLASVSASRPMVSFNVSRTASTWAALQESTHVGVHRLTVAEADLAALFARSGAPRFESVQWRLGAYGVPILHGPESWLIGSVVDRIEAGDSTLLLAEVLQVQDLGGGASAGHPLVYSTGAFASAQPM